MKLRLTALSLAFSALFFFAPATVTIGADTSQPGNTATDSFGKAKKVLHNIIYREADWRRDLYCGCRYDQKKKVDPASCGYVPEKDNARAHRIEWEHVVPAEAFGQRFREWREGHPDCVDNKGRPFKGRKCAEKVNMAFRYMQADIFNLYPAVGEVNGLRSNYSMAMIPGSRYRFGECGTKIEDRKIEPRPEVRGDIARTYLYMDRAYPGHGIISGKNEKLFRAWDKMDPVDERECVRARKIAKIQGNVNMVAEEACQRLQRKN